MSYDTKNLIIRQGKTFSLVLRWETEPIVYKAISAITQTAPVSITATAHGVPDGWNVAVVSARGMTEINAESDPPDAADYHKATVVDANTIELNDVNASEYRAYTSGGYVQYNTPHSLAGYTARMTIRTSVGGTELLSLTTENGGIDIDDTAKTIVLTISATDTAAITDWTRGVYDLELVSSGGVVTGLAAGSVRVIKEVTT